MGDYIQVLGAIFKKKSAVTGSCGIRLNRNWKPSASKLIGIKKAGEK